MPPPQDDQQQACDENQAEDQTNFQKSDLTVWLLPNYIGASPVA